MTGEKSKNDNRVDSFIWHLGVVWKDEISDAGWEKINSNESFIDLHKIHCSLVCVISR